MRCSSWNLRQCRCLLLRWLTPAVVLASAICALLPASVCAQEQLVEGWKLDLTWDDAVNHSDVKDAAPGDRVRLVCSITGADSLQGFVLQLRGRAVGESPRGSWLFRDTLGCRPASYEIAAKRVRGATAPWARPLIIHDVKYGAVTGAAVIIAAGAFDLAVLNPDSTYVLCTFDLIPPGTGEEGECSGWDSSAIFDLVGARVLHAVNREIPIDAPRKILALRIGGPS